ncbi:MAG: ABC transporter ATP-binding protein [Vulcanimicrobiota bacterium]
MPILKAVELSFSYNKDRNILSGINLEVESGDFLAIMGPNGAGKTTLFNLLSAADSPTGGSVLLEDENIRNLKRKEIAKKIGYVPQNTQVDFPFTCEEIVLMGRFAYLTGLGIEKETDKKIALEAMEKTGITHLAQRKIHQLSGGERQRVFIAQAIASQPRILMLDEPIAFLDIRYKVQILNLIRELNESGITIITILHDLNLALRYARTGVLLKDGKVFSAGKPVDILTPQNIKTVYEIEVEKVVSPDNKYTFITPVDITDREILPS